MGAGLVLRGELHAREAGLDSVRSTIWLRDVSFAGRVDFRGTRFMADADFGGTAFADSVIFEDAKFSAGTQFKGARFETGRTSAIVASAGPTSDRPSSSERRIFTPVAVRTPLSSRALTS